MTVRCEVVRSRDSISDSFYDENWDPEYLTKAAEKMSELCEKYNGIPSKTTVSEDGLTATKVFIFPDDTDLASVQAEWANSMNETEEMRTLREGDKSNGKTQVTFFD